MDVFALTPEARRYFHAAALQAAHALSLFAALDRPQGCAELAARLGVREGRLRPLLDVLALEGSLQRVGPAFAAPAALPPAPPPMPAQGHGLLAQVLLRDEPLPEPGVLGTASEALCRFHEHLCAAGAGAAAELADLLARRLGALPAPSLLDLGSGRGVYSAALLERLPAASALLVDRPDVLQLIAPRERVELRPGDLFSVSLGEGHAVALVANVLHLFGADECRALLARAARALAPGGTLVVKDLRVDEDRAGPPASLYFALTMALFTARGDVHPASAIEGWLREAGLPRVERAALRSSPDAQVLLASA
jgi:hypothetical protein